MYKQFNSKEESKKKNPFEILKEVMQRFYPLNEAVIYKEMISKKQGYCIFSDPQNDRDFELDPYIKIYNKMDQKSATELIRVSMKTGKLVYHKNRYKDAGKTNLKFTKEVCDFLIEALPKRYIGNGRYPEGATIYDVIYIDIDNAIGHKCERYPIPDFTKSIQKGEIKK